MEDAQTSTGGISHLTAAFDTAIDVTSASAVTSHTGLVTATAAEINCHQDLAQATDLSTKSNSEVSDPSLSTTSSNTLHHGDQYASNKKSKVVGSIGNNVQHTTKQQPHIIRHHTIPQAQSLQIVSSASHRPNSNVTQSSPLSGNISVTSSKTTVANNAQVLLSTSNCSGGSSSESTVEGVQIGRFTKVKNQHINQK